MTTTCIPISEAVTWKCPVKKVFFKISQNLQENTYARASFLFELSSVISKVFVADFEHEQQLLPLDSLKSLARKQILTQS